MNKIVNHASADDFVLMLEAFSEAHVELGGIDSEGIMLGDVLRFERGDIASLLLMLRDGSSSDADEL